MGVFNISVDGIDGILPGERAPRSIFNAGDIKKQLPGESAKFQEIVSWWIGSGGNGAVCCGGHDRFSSKCSMFYFCETGFLYLKLRHPDFMGKCFAFHFPSVDGSGMLHGQGCTMAADHEGLGQSSEIIKIYVRFQIPLAGEASVTQLAALVTAVFPPCGEFICVLHSWWVAFAVCWIKSPFLPKMIDD